MPKTARLLVLLLLLIAAGCQLPGPRLGGGAPPCKASDLVAVHWWQQDGTSANEGEIDLVNAGEGPCVIRGPVGVLLSDSGGPLPVQVQQGMPAGPSPATAAVVAAGVGLEKPGSAFVSTQWLNWCGTAQDQVGLRVSLNGGQHLGSQATSPGSSTPPCTNPGAPSIFYVSGAKRYQQPPKQ